MNQKGLAPILIVILIAAALVGGYLVYQNKIRSDPYPPLNYHWAKLSSPKPKVEIVETANWKTYQGDYFSIKYPQTYTLQEGTTSMNLNYTKPSSYVKFQDRIDILVITVAENPLELTLDNALGKGPYFSYVKDELIGKKVNKVRIDNVDAVMVEDLIGGLEGTALDLIVIKDNKIYQFYSPHLHYNDLDQILSTFRFD